MGRDLEQLIPSYAKRIKQKIERLLPRRPTEPDFRRALGPLLEEFLRKAGVEDPDFHEEYTLVTGRADAVFNRFVIEYEQPGRLSDRLSHKQTAQAVDQVKKYIKGLATRQRREVHRIAGVALDGYYIVFVRYRDGDFSVEGPTAVSQASLERFLRWLAGLAPGTALTAENLNRDFSIEQPDTRNILRAFWEGLDKALQGDVPMVRNLFEQWRLFFGESVDYSEAFGGRKLETLKKWVPKAGLTVETTAEAERFFFCLHTYFALLVKLIGWLALSRHLAGKLGTLSFGELAGADGETLRRSLAEMESGGIFRAYGITNLLEGDFFAWYLYAWNDRIESAIRGLLTRLDRYDPATIAVVPEETRDLFKSLYHYLLPREIRHGLGEYYTPDWLAQWLLNRVDGGFFTADPRSDEKRLRRKLLNLRWLDPACGSGTFLVLLIARMKELGRELMVKETELLDAILNNVVGFDLNPLAVITARVNYLLAISDLLPYRKGDITLPVYLADSVRTPAVGGYLLTAGNYEFPTAVGTFLVPDALCTKERFDRFCDLLEESIRSGMAPGAFLHRIEKAFNLTSPEWTQRDAQIVGELYEKMSELHRNGMNGLWARLLKNNFAPLTAGRFDYIVGNPPWINWEHLPDRYREAVRPIWMRYGLFPHGGMDAILGKGKKDISMLMTYVVCDTLLKYGGKLGFLITQSVFKTSGAGEGFRRFCIPQGEREVPLRVVHVDDMVSLQPFEGASNRTAAFVLKKGKSTTYPVPYTVWRKVKGARFTYDSTLGEVTAATERLDFVAEPVDPKDPTSPWLTARPNALKAVRQVLGRSDYEAHEGVNTGGANAVYWVDIVLKRPDGLVVVRNITEGAKVKVDEVTEAIEPGLLYPLLRGRDVQRWKAEPSAWLIMVQDPQKRRGIDESQLQTRYPRTYGYLKRFEKVLRQRAAFKRYFTRKDGNGRVVETGPFYSMFDVGTYTFAPWKVVWTRVATDITAAVVGDADVCGVKKPIVPVETATMVDFQNPDEAHFVCAVVNSSPWRFAIVATAVHGTGGFGSPNVLEKARIPRFDPKNSVHRRLAELSQQAHQAAKSGDEEALRKIEAQIDQEAAKLWGLTDDELHEIQESLKINL